MPTDTLAGPTPGNRRMKTRPGLSGRYSALNVIASSASSVFIIWLALWLCAGGDYSLTPIDMSP